MSRKTVFLHNPVLLLLSLLLVRTGDGVCVVSCYILLPLLRRRRRRLINGTVARGINDRVKQLSRQTTIITYTAVTGTGTRIVYVHIYIYTVTGNEIISRELYI